MVAVQSLQFGAFVKHKTHQIAPSGSKKFRWTNDEKPRMQLVLQAQCLCKVKTSYGAHIETW